MIETKSGVISQKVADDGYTSLEGEVIRKRTAGKLDAGLGKTFEVLPWTAETVSAAKEFESSLDLTGLESLSLTVGEASASDIKWVGPIIYADVNEEPIRYPSSAKGYGVLGILALGNLTLPDVGGTSGKTISSGSVAYFRDASPVEYKLCSGRGLLFYISN